MCVCVYIYTVSFALSAQAPRCSARLGSARERERERERERRLQPTRVARIGCSGASFACCTARHQHAARRRADAPFLRPCEVLECAAMLAWLE